MSRPERQQIIQKIRLFSVSPSSCPVSAHHSIHSLNQLHSGMQTTSFAKQDKALQLAGELTKTKETDQKSLTVSTTSS